MEFEFEDRYCLDCVIGRGGYGTVYLAHNKSSKKKVAVKVEMVFDLHDPENSYLKREFDMYIQLKRKGAVGIADIELFGVDEDDEGPRNYLVMELLGPDLETLLHQCSGKFTLSTVLLLADQMIRIIQYIHSNGFIHGDVKPGNFLLGRKKKDKMIYVVDFGFAKAYRDAITKQHIPYSDTASYHGTTRFTSLNSHCGVEQSRRDDMESLGYVFLYLLRGNLPWQDITVFEASDKKKQKRKLVYEKKLSTTIEELCSGCPSEFETYMKYCRSLQFDEEPDYTYLRKLFKDLFNRSGYCYQLGFDWRKRTVISDKKYSHGKFMEDDSVAASDVLPWELKYFMNVQYHIVDPKNCIQEASIEEILEDTFQFIYPDEIPEFFCNIQEKRNKTVFWEDIVHELYDDIMKHKTLGVKWLRDNFIVDYAKKDSNFKVAIYRQSLNLEHGQENDIVGIGEAANLALRMDRLFCDLIGQPKRTLIPDNIERLDKLKGVMYALFSLVQVSIMINGECKLSFDHPSIQSKCERHHLNVKAEPDVVLFTNSKDTYIPYCAVEVHGQYGSKVDYKIIVGHQNLSNSSSVEESDDVQSDDLPESLVALSNPKISGGDKINENQPYMSQHFRLQLTRDIKSIVPHMCKRDFAFDKVAGQLPLEIYALSVLAERCKLHITCLKNRLKTKETCTNLGLFIVNEYIYVVKFIYKKNLFHPLILGEYSDTLAENCPEIVYANWCFDLKKPNHRIAFLTFLYYYDQSMRAELKSS